METEPSSGPNLLINTEMIRMTSEFNTATNWSHGGMEAALQRGTGRQKQVMQSAYSLRRLTNSPFVLNKHKRSTQVLWCLISLREERTTFTERQSLWFLRMKPEQTDMQEGAASLNGNVMKSEQMWSFCSKAVHHFTPEVQVCLQMQFFIWRIRCSRQSPHHAPSTTMHNADSGRF